MSLTQRTPNNTSAEYIVTRHLHLHSLIKISVNIQDAREVLTAKASKLASSRFEDVDLANTVFDDVNLGQTTFTNVNLTGCSFANVNMTNVAITKANLTGMTVNGVLLSEMMQVYQERGK